jgi:hypothetical protein
MLICVYLSMGFGYPFGFLVSIWVLGIHGFGFGDGFSLESVFGSGLGFNFGFQFWVHGDSTRSEPDSLPSLGPTYHPLGVCCSVVSSGAVWNLLE